MYCDPAATAGSVKKVLTPREVAFVTAPDTLTPLGGSRSYEIKRRLLKDPCAAPLNETGMLTEPAGLSRVDLNPLTAKGGFTCAPLTVMLVVQMFGTTTVGVMGLAGG